MFAANVWFRVRLRRPRAGMSSKTSTMKKEEKEKTDVTVKPAPRKPSRASRREKKQGKDVAKEPVNQNGDPVDMIFMDI